MVCDTISSIFLSFRWCLSPCMYYSDVFRPYRQPSQPGFRSVVGQWKKCVRFCIMNLNVSRILKTSFLFDLRHWMPKNINLSVESNLLQSKVHCDFLSRYNLHKDKSLYCFLDCLHIRPYSDAKKQICNLDLCEDHFRLSAIDCHR